MSTQGNPIPRKIFHLVLASVPPLVYLAGVLDRTGMAIGLLALAVVSFKVEWLRFRVPSVNRLFIRAFGPLMKEKEFSGPTSVNHTLLSYFIVVLGADPDIAAASMLFLSVGDPVASEVGRRLGKPGPGSKSWAGCVGNFCASSLVGMAVLPGLVLALSGGAASALTELFAGRIDDNLLVPLGSAAVLTGLRYGLGA